MGTLLGLLHVGTAVFIVGPMAIIPMTGLRALRSGNAAQVRTLARSTSVFSWLSLLTFLFGFGTMAFADPKYGLTFTTPWILGSIVAYGIAFLLSIFVVVPRMRQAAEEAEGEGTQTVEGQDAEAAGDDNPDAGTTTGSYRVIAASSGIVSSLLVVVVILMILKP